MASAGAHLPLWDKNNTEQEALIYGSELDEVLVQATVNLRQHLQLDNVWAHLEALGVLRLTDIENIQHNRSRPQRVEELLRFIRTGGSQWQYHALMRAMALTGQGKLIPGQDPNVYHPEEDHSCTQHQDAFRLSQQLLKDIWDHCRFCKETLLTSHLFTFEGDSGDDLIDLAGSIIEVKPNVKDAKSCIHHGEMIRIEGSMLLEQLGDSSPPVTVRLYADPGDGKTSFARYTVYSWSIDFLKRIINKGGKLCLKSRSPKWTLMVFLSARNIKTTVEAAIQEHLGCRSTDELMAHINRGEGVAIFIDGYDECRNPETLKKIDSYVHDCQRKGGPTVVITCRTHLCSIDGKYFNRFVTLSGFSDEQGLRYIKLYTELCQPLLPQPSDAPSVYEYANQHRAKLKAILCNPLKLHIFVALALRGEIDLSVGDDFHVPSLFTPLERYLLRREGVEVTEEQSQAFYRLCMHALLNDIREFPESLLEEFRIVQSYHVFMIKSERRNITGKLESFYNFGHEVILEFFASRYILSLNNKERISLLLVICRDRQMRNVQKLIFELLAQEGAGQIKLLQTMIRSILILQFGKANWKFSKTLYDLMHLPDKIKTGIQLEDMLRSKDGRITIKNAAGIWQKIDKAFQTHADTLRSFGWFILDNNGTIQHVVDCVQACPPDVQEQLIKNTIHCLLPCREKTIDRGMVWYYAVGGTRWAEVQVDLEERWPIQEYISSDKAILSAWCPGDAAESLVQHAATSAEWCDEELNGLYIRTNMYGDLWGQPGEGRGTQEEWHKLLQVLPKSWGTSCMWVYLHKTAPVTGLLSCFTDHPAHMSQRERIKVELGTADLVDLVACVSKCAQVGLKVVLKDTDIVLPEKLRTQEEAGNIQADVLHVTAQVLSTNYTELYLPRTVPVTAVLSTLTDHAIHLSQYEKIAMHGGTAHLDDLVTCVSRCIHVGIKVVLFDIHIMLPERLRAQGETDNTPVQAGVLRATVEVWSQDYIQVYLHKTAPVTGLLSWLLDNAVHLSPCKRIALWYGQPTTEVEDLVACVCKCTQAGLEVGLYHTHIVLPESLRDQKDKLHQLKDSLNVLELPFWATETGEEYIWS